MQLIICAGKGGVGKTTVATALGVAAATHRKVALIDFDDGHSVLRTLNIRPPAYITDIGIIKHYLFKNGELYVAPIDDVAYIDILEAQKRKWPFDWYLKQFPGDQGIVPLLDMVTGFFGVLTDTSSVLKFTQLITILLHLKESAYDTVVIDVEPTAGLKRLLQNADALLRSMGNLRKNKLKMLVISSAWPDIGKYLKSEYPEHIEDYIARMESVISAFCEAIYLLVTTPEKSPVEQTLQVAGIIESFGATVSGYVVNNLREEASEQMQIKTIEDRGLPIAKIVRQGSLHAGDDPIRTLIKIGESVRGQLQI